MERTYGIAHIQWVVPPDQHERWHLIHGRLARPVRFHNGDGSLWDMCFALAEATYHDESLIVPIAPLFEIPIEWMIEGATFDVFIPTIVAVGRVISIETSGETEFYHIFRSRP